VLAAIALPRASACADPSILRVGLVQQPNSLDPLHAVQFYENYLAEALFSALTVIDDRGNVAPDLAETVPTRGNGGVSADGKTIRYRLRRGVRWQDGVPLTSRDVAFTFARMLDPKTNFPEASIYSAIERVETPDDRTVVLHLRAPWADATALLFVGGEDGSIVPAHVLRSVADLGASTFEAHPLGSGPYALERWDRGNRIVLRANPTYFRGRPHIDRIDIEFVPDQNTLALRLQTGELDFSPQLPQSAALRLLGVAGLRHRTVPTYADVELGFNTKLAPFDDPRVRRGLALAIDRRRLTSSVYHGFAVPADDLVPPQSPAHVADPHFLASGDRTEAGRLLDAAGWQLGGDGVRRKNRAPLSFPLTLPTGLRSVEDVAVQLQAMWRALGVEAALRPVLSNVMYASATGLLPRGDFSAFIGPDGYATPPDRSDTLTTSGLPPAGRNYTRFSDAEVDRWTQTARRTLDDRKRNVLYARISARVREKAALVPLLWQQQLYVYTERLQGLRPEPVNSDFWNSYQWRLLTRLRQGL
jgi:peptide/nickel transport system substrate-binding protein